MTTKRKQDGVDVFSYPRDQLSIEPADVVAHMRGDALSYMATRGADDPVGEWLWRLSNVIERDLIESRREESP